MRHTSTLTRLTIFMVCCLMLSVGFSQAQEIPQGLPNPWEARAAALPRGTLDVDVVTVESDGDTIVTEFGASDTFTMALAAQPSAPIVIRHDFLSNFTILPKEITFTPENWDVPQTLTVYAEHDYAIDTGDIFPPIYTAETVEDGIYDFTYFTLDFSVSVLNMPKVIPTGPLVVTTLADSVSEEIEGSLRQMIQIANARAGADTITFQAGLTGTLTLAGDLPIVSGNTTIIGTGQDQLTIDGGGVYSGFVASGSIALESLTLINLWTAAWGAVSLTDVTVTDSGHGSSLSWGFPAVYGETVTLNRVTMRGNSGVYGGAVGGEKTISVKDSTFTDNHAVEVVLSDGVVAFGGGAIYIGTEGDIVRSTFVDNSAPYGGAIYVTDNENIPGSQIIVSIIDNRFHENSADEGGAVFTDYGSTYISRSLFTANQAMDGGAIDSSGGGSAYHDITNSTFSGNLNTSPTGAAAVSGTAMIILSTFSGHHTNASNSAGVVRGGPSGSMLLFGVIIANNNEANPLECSGQVIGDNNLTNATNCAGHFDAPTGVDPVLRDNGGFTQTHALLEGSNAIDADRVFIGDPDDTTGCGYLEIFSGLLGDVVDQRGNPRPVGRACDIGAFESEFTAPLVNLLSNSSFEATSSHPKLNVWQGKNLLASDKRVCTSSLPSLITADGDCVFQFKANSTPTKARSITQTVYSRHVDITYDALTLSAMVEGHNLQAGAKINLVVTYEDAPRSKLAIEIPSGTYAFSEISQIVMLDGTVESISISINVAKVMGRLRVDELRLTPLNGGRLTLPVDGTRDGAIQELPAVPDGFRDMK